MNSLQNGRDSSLFGIPWSLVRYCAVGVVNTCVGLGTIYFGMYALNMGSVPANMLGYAIGITVSFTLNKYWTFSRRDNAQSQIVKFLMVTGCAYVVNLATILIADRFGANKYLAQALAVGPYLVVGYIGNRYFTFK